MPRTMTDLLLLEGVVVCVVIAVLAAFSAGTRRWPQRWYETDLDRNDRMDP